MYGHRSLQSARIYLLERRLPGPRPSLPQTAREDFVAHSKFQVILEVVKPNRSSVARWITAKTGTEAALALWERTGLIEAHRPGQGRAGAEYSLEQAVAAMLVTV